MSLPALVDGLPADTVDIRDRGLQFGDGCFETLRVRNGRPVLWRLHWERLERGLRQLGIAPPDPAHCLDEIAAHTPRGERLVKLMITRGSSPRGYAIPAQAHSRRILLVGEALSPPEPTPRDLKVGICRTRVHSSPVQGAKHLNRLENVLARREWARGWDEGLMTRSTGEIVCGTAANVFMVEDDRLITPPVQRYGIAGTRRRWLIESAAALGIEVREEYLRRRRLYRVGACWLTSTALGIRRARISESRVEPSEPSSAAGSLEQIIQGLSRTLDEMD